MSSIKCLRGKPSADRRANLWMDPRVVFLVGLSNSCCNSIGASRCSEVSLQLNRPFPSRDCTLKLTQDRYVANRTSRYGDSCVLISASGVSTVANRPNHFSIPGYVLKSPVFLHALGYLRGPTGDGYCQTVTT
jgi:hypothetical protein